MEKITENSEETIKNLALKFAEKNPSEICEKSKVVILIPQKTLRKWFWSNRPVPKKTAHRLIQLGRKIKEAQNYLQHIESIIVMLLGRR